MPDEEKPLEQPILSLFLQAEEGRQLLGQLYRVAIAMQTSWEPQDRLHAFLQGAHEVVGFDRGSVLLATPDGSQFDLVAAYGQESPLASLPLSAAAGAYYQAFQTRQPVVVLRDEDLGTILPLAPPYRYYPELRTRRFVIVPLVVGERAIGVVSFDNKTSRRPIDPLIIEPFTLLCQQFATAWEAARLYAETRAREQEATQLYEITAQLASSLDLDHVLDLITTKAVELLGCDGSGIYMYNEARGGLTYSRGLHTDPELMRDLVLSPGEGIAGRAFQERRPVWSSDRRADPSVRYYSAATERLIDAKAARAALAAPLISQGEVQGVLMVRFFAPHDFSPKE